MAAGKSPTPQVFHYIDDFSPLGYGTPPRVDLPWSRRCGNFGPINCPGSNNNITTFQNATGVYSQGDWYDSRVPKNLTDLFQSGLATMSRSVSSIFDIQYRSYTWSQIDDYEDTIRIDNGSAYAVSSYRQISSLLLRDAVVPVAGLIVNMESSTLR